MASVANPSARVAQQAFKFLKSPQKSHYSSWTSSACNRPTHNSKFKIAFPIVAAGSILGTAAFFTSSESKVQSEPLPKESSEKIALNPEKWVEFKLQETARVSHNTQLYRFSFDPNAKLGLHVASCIITRAPLGSDDQGKPKYVVRPYTPISDPDLKGHFDLMIKIYPEGKMSQYIASLKPGDTLEVKGPIEKLRYSPNTKKHIGMIAGGTGITPMLQVIDAILKNPEDNTRISLLYANISPDDILLKQKLDALSVSHPNFKVYYVVDKPSHEWRGGVGYISMDMILKGLPCPSDDTLILVCGPPGMMHHISGDKDPDRSQGEVSGLLKEAGYTKEMVYKF